MNAALVREEGNIEAVCCGKGRDAQLSEDVGVMKGICEGTA